MRINPNLILVAAVALALLFFFNKKENFRRRQDISKRNYPLGFSTIKITPYNTIVKMPYDLPPTLSTDSCVSACSVRSAGPNVILGKGVFDPRGKASADQRSRVSTGGSSVDCTMACST
jgi:hypothetical protein